MELEITTLEKCRIGTTLTMRVRLKDSGVYISWARDIEIKRICMYSEAQGAYAGYCTYSVDESDDTVLIAKYPANQQSYLGAYRLIIEASTSSGVSTYDALAFELVATLEEAVEAGEIDIELEITSIPSSVIRDILDACIEATEAANSAAASVEDVIEDAEDAIEDAEGAKEEAEAAAEAANEAAEAAGRRIKTLGQFPWVDQEFARDDFLELLNADVIVYSDCNDYATGKITPAEEEGEYYLQMIRLWPADDYSREMLLVNIRIWTDDEVTYSVTDVWSEYLARMTEVYTKIQVDARIANAIKGSFRSVPVLPQPPTASMLGYIYLVPSEAPGQSNAKDEYIVIEDGDTYKWERIGKTEIDLSGYLQLSGGTMTGDIDLGGNAIADNGGVLIRKHQDGAPQIGDLGSSATVHIGGRTVVRHGPDGAKTLLDSGSQTLSSAEKMQARANIDAQEILEFDTEPVEGSDNPITSGGVHEALQIILDAEYPRALALLDEEF